MNADSAAVCTVSGLSVDYRVRGAAVRAVHDVHLTLFPGRICGMAGESGSGKSTAALAALGWATAVQRRAAGTSVLDGINLFELPARRLRQVWGRRIGYVPQEIGGSLHPGHRVGRQFREVLRSKRGMTRRQADARALELLDAARVPGGAATLRRFPHEFSGGQLQRLAIALALAPRPDVLILDEPTTGLDVTTQRAVTGVLRDLVDRERVAALFITHDLALLSELADDLVIMYAGEVVETGPTERVLAEPGHPYTRALIDAVPHPGRAVTLRGIPGLPPGRFVPDRCGFAERCPHRVDGCVRGHPPLAEISGGRFARCVRAGELSLRGTLAAARVPPPGDRPPCLEVDGLTCVYRSGAARTVAARSVCLTVPGMGVTALVGESGSGKSTIGRAIAGLLTPLEGSIVLAGERLPISHRARTRAQRRAVQFVFQDASASLNPRRTVGDQLRHVAGKLLDASPARREEAVTEMLAAVRLPPELLDRYPGQLSGGQRQRVAIARAFLPNPRLVVCDEITSGQDVSVQAAILDTIADMRARYGTAVLFISHDLGVVRSIADTVHVLRHGEIVEHGPAEDLFDRPGHAYTRELLAAVPILDRRGDPAWPGRPSPRVPSRPPAGHGG